MVQVMQVRKRDTTRIYALKTIRKVHIVNRNKITHTLAEHLVLAQVDSPFIVPFEFGSYYIVLDDFFLSFDSAQARPHHSFSLSPSSILSYESKLMIPITPASTGTQGRIRRRHP